MMVGDFIRQILLRRPVERAMPSLDGPWRANEWLDRCQRLAPDVAAPADLAVDDRGTLFVASGNRVLALGGPKLGSTSIIASLPGPVSCLCWHRLTGLIAGVTGAGIVKIGAGGAADTLLPGGDLRHPTGLAVAEDGSILASEGSAQHGWNDWVRDLMNKGASGRLLRIAAGHGRTEVLADGLAFPTGVAVRPSDGAVMVAEAWRHRVLCVLGDGRRTTVLENLPGYPARLLYDTGTGGWWLSLFAPRSHLVEFVLGEEVFRRRMVETIEPQFWVAPTNDAREHHLQPVQIGGLRSQNIKKPWAPSWSYGLVACFDEDFEPMASFHSRANGARHGTGGLAMIDDEVLVASAGGNCILRLTSTVEGGR